MKEVVVVVVDAIDGWRRGVSVVQVEATAGPPPGHPTTTGVSPMDDDGDYDAPDRRHEHGATPLPQDWMSHSMVVGGRQTDGQQRELL